MFYSAGSGFDEGGTSYGGCWDFIPPVPIMRGFYRCDSKFHTSAIERLYITRKTFGYVLIAGENVLLYKSDTVKHTLVNTVQAKRQKHQKKGGQSAPRIEREAEKGISIC